MADGKAAIGQLQGKVDSTNALVIVGQAVSGTPRGGSPIMNLQGSVNASNALKVTFG